jgi:uncharacterized protein
MVFTKKISVTGMHCSGCETIINEAIGEIEGVQFVKSNYAKGTVEVRYDSDSTNLEYIFQVISSKGYTVSTIHNEIRKQVFQIIFSILALVGLFMIILVARKLGHQLKLPEINSRTSDGLIFVVGLLTGLHCVGMCGSFIIGYTSRDVELGRSIFRSHLLYGTGKTLSYTMFGAIFGLIGSLFHITPLISGITICLAGAFLFLYGLNMLNVFSALKAIRIKQPTIITRYVVEKKRKSKGPFFIGFFSGFILGCGPLQAMYILAAGNGEIVEGAKILALFGLGTLPALFSFGLIVRLLSNRMTQRIIKVSGIILIVLGSMMVSKGIVRSGLRGEIKSEQSGSCCHAPAK